MQEANIKVDKVVKYLVALFEAVPPSKEMFKFYQLGKHIRFFNGFKGTKHPEQVLFDIVAPQYDNEVSTNDEIIKVGSSGIRVFHIIDDNFGSNHFNFTISEEEFFQNSLVHNYGNITYETIMGCKKIVEFLHNLE